MAGIATVAQISGAHFNPARSFGPAFVSLLLSTNPLYWYPLYIIGPILGGLLAATLYGAIYRSKASTAGAKAPTNS